MWAARKKLSTTIKTTFKLVEEPALAIIEEDLNPPKNVVVSKISRVQKIETFLKCQECHKRMYQSSLNDIIQCDSCKAMMRLEDCEKSINAKIVVILPDTNEDITITINEEVLNGFFGENVAPFDEQNSQCLKIIQQ